MPNYRLRCEMTVPKPLSEVFEMFENPLNLAKITPPWLAFEILTPPSDIAMRKGLVIDYRFRWMNLPLRWRTLISEYRPPFEFVDRALRSPYAYWIHRHQFEVVPEGTRVIDTVDYGLPLGPIGQLTHAMMVKRNVTEIFTYRQKVLNEHWGGNSKITWPTVQEIDADSAAA